MMIEAGDQDAKLTLLELAAAFHHITDYTDGSETNHIRSSYYAAVAKHYPERIAPMLDDLIRAEDWRYVEDLYEELPSLPLAQTVEGGALLASNWSLATTRRVGKISSGTRASQPSTFGKAGMAW